MESEANLALDEPIDPVESATFPDLLTIPGELRLATNCIYFK